MKWRLGVFNLRKPLRWRFSLSQEDADGEFYLLVRRPSLQDKKDVDAIESNTSSMEEIIRRSVVGWQGIVAEGDEGHCDMEFSPENFDELLGINELSNELAQRLLELWYGRPVSKEQEKNLKTQSTPSVEE